MKLFLIKVLIVAFCVPAYPIYLVGAYVERSSYLGSKPTLRGLSREYWADVWDAITYKEGGET